MFSNGLSEKEALAQERALQERREIVSRYDLGREEGARIDDWEDPKLEIYHTQDRYGFIHDERQPLYGHTGKEAKAKERELGRVKKWLEMVETKNKQHWFKQGARHHEKFVERVWKGIPERMRGIVWAELLDLNTIKKQQPGKYEEMRLLARKYSPEIRQIDLDVNRTFRNHIMFRERYCVRQQDLFHVLAAYSMYNTEIGYCQGMSQIAALLLMYLEQAEDAFWALSQLMVLPKFSMHGFFIPGFPKLLRFQEHYDKILLKKLKRLQKHLMKNGVDTGIYTLKWFFQCFLERLPFSLSLRVWDLFMLYGESLMFCMAFTVMRVHKKTLLRMDSLEKLIDFLQKELTFHFGFEDDEVVEALKESMAELRSSKLFSPGPTPEEERPQKPFGLFVPQEEEYVPVLRQPTTRIDRNFKERSLARREEQEQVLRHVDSKQSLNSVGDETDSLLGIQEDTSSSVFDKSHDSDFMYLPDEAEKNPNCEASSSPPPSINSRRLSGESKSSLHLSRQLDASLSEMLQQLDIDGNQITENILSTGSTTINQKSFGTLSHERNDLSLDRDRINHTRTHSDNSHKLSRSDSSRRNSSHKRNSSGSQGRRSIRSHERNSSGSYHERHSLGSHERNSSREIKDRTSNVSSEGPLLTSSTYSRSRERLSSEGWSPNMHKSDERRRERTSSNNSYKVRSSKERLNEDRGLQVRKSGEKRSSHDARPPLPPQDSPRLITKVRGKVRPPSRSSVTSPSLCLNTSVDSASSMHQSHNHRGELGQRAESSQGHYYFGESPYVGDESEVVRIKVKQEEMVDPAQEQSIYNGHKVTIQVGGSSPVINEGSNIERKSRNLPSQKKGMDNSFTSTHSIYLEEVRAPLAAQEDDNLGEANTTLSELKNKTKKIFRREEFF